MKKAQTTRRLVATIAMQVVMLGIIAMTVLLFITSCGLTPTPIPSPSPILMPTAVPTLTLAPAPSSTPVVIPTTVPTPATPTLSAPAVVPFIVPPIRVNIIIEGAEAEVTVYGNLCKPPCLLDIEVGDPLLIDVKDPPPQVGSRYVFTGWSDGGERRHEVKPTSETTYTAYFKRQYELQVTSPYGVVTGGGWYDEGSQVTPSVNPIMIEERSETRRLYTGWSEALPVTMTGPKVVTAIWKTQYKLTVLISGSGKVDPSGGWFDEGASVVLTPSTASTGWWFDSFSIPSPIIMNVSKEITAYFASESVTLSTVVNPPGAGSISPNGGLHNYSDQVTLTASPIPGWYFSSWRGDVSDIHNPLTITMNTSKTVTANFFRYSADVPLPLQPPTEPVSPGTPSVTLLPTQPASMSSVLVSGAGWVQGNTVFLDVFKTGAMTPSISLKISPNAYGYFTVIFNLSSNLEAGTTGNLVATDALSHKATATFKVISGPSITVSPVVVSWGQTINISGRGFLPLSKMLYGFPWNGGSYSFSPPVYADSSGSFNTKIVMPTVSRGARMIGVTDGTNLATAYIDVTESPHAVISH